MKVAKSKSGTLPRGSSANVRWRITVAAIAIPTGLYLTYTWWFGVQPRDSARGLFLLAVMSFIVGLDMLAKLVGWNIFGRDDRTRSSGDWDTDLGADGSGCDGDD